MNIFLVDLRASVDCGREMPLGIANIAALLKQKLPDFGLELFTDPNELNKRLLKNPPDLYMSSHYSWNRNLSTYMARKAREANPRVVNIFGGPNVPGDILRRTMLLSQHPEIDFHVLGFNGELPALALIRALMLHDFNVARTQAEPDELDSVMFLDRGKYKEAPLRSKLKTLDELPSPYSAGLMEKFFAERLVPRIQGTRGCPYSCSFCRLGVVSYNRVIQLSVDRFAQDLEHIVQGMKTHRYVDGLLRIADDNFGMPPKDYEKALLLRQAHDTHGFPSMITTDTSKFVDDKAFRTLNVIKDLLYISNTSQSLNPSTLEAINRPNKGFEFFSATSKRLIEAGFSTRSEVISGLPLETRETFVQGLEKLDRLDFSDLSIYQLTLTDGAALDSAESVDRYKIKVKYRLFYGSTIDIDGDVIGEYDRVVVGTNTMTEEDYHSMRLMGFLMKVFSSFRNRFYFDILYARYGFSGPRLASLLADTVMSAANSENRALLYLRQFVEAARKELLNAPIPPESPHELPANLVHQFSALLMARAYPDFCSLLTQTIIDRQLDPREVELLQKLCLHLQNNDVRTAISQGLFLPEACRTNTFNEDDLLIFQDPGVPSAQIAELATVPHTLPTASRQAVNSFLLHTNGTDAELEWGYRLIQTRHFKLRPSFNPVGA